MKERRNRNPQSNSCDPNCKDAPTGPVREAGGTNGAGNLSPGGADRTGGATAGVDSEPNRRQDALRPPPSA